MILEILDNLGIESIVGEKNAALSEMKNINAHIYLEKNDTFRIAKIKIHHYGKNILEDAKAEFYRLKIAASGFLMGTPNILCSSPFEF
jgi:hypothetical protein